MEYETALRSCGTEIAFFYLKEAESFFLNISEFLDFLRAEQPEIIFLCTPANPTGTMIRQADLSKILDYCKKHGILLVLDECFVEFLDEERSCGCIREFLDWETGRPEHGGNLDRVGDSASHIQIAGIRPSFQFGISIFSVSVRFTIFTADAFSAVSLFQLITVIPSQNTSSPFCQWFHQVSAFEY